MIGITNFKTFISLLILVIFFSPLQSEAVKSFLFKKCDQSGFCQRNRHFRNEIFKLGEDYESRYSIDINSLKINNLNVNLNGLILKQLNDGSYIKLNFNIDILKNNDLRLKIDENERKINEKNKNLNYLSSIRYNEASKWSFITESPKLIDSFKYDLNNEYLTLNYSNDNNYKTIIQFYPFKISIYYQNELKIVINDRNLFNLEHYRTKDEQNEINSIHISPEESIFDTYTDSFKDSKSDSKPFGPESVAMDFTMIDMSHVYGIPEHADSLSLKDTTISDSDPYRLYNVDIFEYEVQSKFPMYGSIPLMIGVSPKSSCGIFWVNSADTYIDIKKNYKQSKNDKDSNEHKIEDAIDDNDKPSVQSHWMSENGIIDVVLMIRDKPNEISEAYSELTGTIQLPNIFSIGYHQSRWNYNDETDVLSINSKMDQFGFPYDAIWLDIEYTDDKKYFTWKKDSFPNPDKMVSKLEETGRNLIVIIDPHIKVGYDISKEIEKKGVAILKNDGGNNNNNNKNIAYHGHCWPGESLWVDSLNPNSQELWDKYFRNGSELMGFSTNIHLWNDMNEPSIFNGPETSAPKDLIHYGKWEHRSIHNLYGLTFHESTYESLIKRNPNKRPFILTRSFFAGSQRTCAMWTGDNMAKWEYLKESIPTVLTLNVVGMQFSGADVAGFFGNPDKELLTRWYQTGIWYPFFRAHAHIDSRRHEPWVAGDPYTTIMREAVKLRYRLLPLFYTQFYKSSQTGEAIMTPLWYRDSSNELTYEIDDQFYLGKLLVKPVQEENSVKTNIFLPNNKIYYNFFDFEIIKGEDKYVEIDSPLYKIPLLIEGNSITPMKSRYRRSTKLMKYDPYTLVIALDENFKAIGNLYIDDGETFNNENNDDFIYLQFEFDNGILNSKIIDGGDLTKIFVKSLDQVKIEKIVILSQDTAKFKNINNKSVTVEQNGLKWESELLDGKDNFGNSFIIRNPKVEINKEFTISIL
ncbi:hypothetical protein B5S28_g1557 [[Candida] boidinii]|nr:hypothetical protein B5S28_g1557 [[Candida] boidinii]